MDVYYQRNFTPTVVFTLGNPLLAKEIMKYDMEAGLHIPPQMIVQQTEKGGTKISYDVPSTIMPGAKKPSKGMMASMKTVDQKLEKLVRKVLAV
ncbi:hypothetical protein BDW22DRAFT_1360762 [Trametopsis cervina]|nr:hypothetical protein BDW22DRAFT_1360762 [Trametopsis cervina]